MANMRLCQGLFFKHIFLFLTGLCKFNLLLNNIYDSFDLVTHTWGKHITQNPTFFMVLNRDTNFVKDDWYVCWYNPNLLDCKPYISGST
jgi:hypothetical protein